MPRSAERQNGYFPSLSPVFSIQARDRGAIAEARPQQSLAVMQTESALLSYRQLPRGLGAEPQGHRGIWWCSPNLGATCWLSHSVIQPAGDTTFFFVRIS